MNAGLPGTGLGGLFYLVSALAMILFELVASLRGQSSQQRWRLVIRQALIATTIIIGISLTGLALNKGLQLYWQHSSVLKSQTQPLIHVFPHQPIYIVVGPLVVVIVAVQVLRIYQRRLNQAVE